jgi:hypothetical protein
MLKSLSLCFFSLAALATATTTQAATALYANQQLSVNQSIRSGNNAYYAIMQNDGNFVVYKNDGSGKAIWSTGTNGSAAVKAIMQNDGNFVLLTCPHGAVPLEAR